MSITSFKREKTVGKSDSFYSPGFFLSTQSINCSLPPSPTHHMLTHSFTHIRTQHARSQRSFSGTLTWTAQWAWRIHEVNWLTLSVLPFQVTHKKKNTIKLWTPRGQELGCIHTDLEQVPYNPVDLLAEINIHAFWVLLPMISGVPENEGKFCSTTPNTYQFTLVLHYFSQLPLLFGFTNHLSKSLNS